MANDRVNIKRVAREAGVSTQTISRVINDRPDVSPETRKRVQQIIKELGYQPNAIARSLVSKRTRTLGLITSDFSDYFFTQVIAGAEAEARRHGYFFMLGSTQRNPQDEPAYIRLLIERHVEGILWARPSSEPDARPLTMLLDEGIPVVTTAYHLPNHSLTVVDVDNVDGAQQAVRCLLENGRRQIAMIAGPATWKSVIDRRQGYISALRAAGVPLRATLIAQGDWSFASGYRAASELLAKGRVFTGLFAQNDQMAIGAIHALREAGKRVPEDVAVVGYDDIPVAEFSDPPLTTIRQPMCEVGQVATRLLIEATENLGAAQEGALLQATLVKRKSCP